MSRERLSDLRKLYGGLPADELAGLKARALETGEPLSRAAARHGGDRSKSKSTAIDLNMSRAASEIVKANPPMSKSKTAALFQCSGSVPATVPALLARKHHHHSYLKVVVVVVVLRASQGAGTAGSPEDTHMRPPAPARVCAAACVHEDLGGLVIQRTESGGNRRGIARKQRNRRASRYVLPRQTRCVGWTPSGTTGVPVIQRPFQRGDDWVAGGGA